MKKLLRLLSVLSFSTFVTNNNIACINEPNKDQKTNLNTITKLTGLNLKVASNQKYQALTNDIIFSSDQFKKKPLVIGFAGFSIKYYNSETDKEDIFNENQKSGNFWIIIKVPSCEPNWTGKTPRLKLMLNS